jgi:NAD(P)-dependent dehydrogenase (short-subunit alcohol dehydrogenase family)
MANRKIVLTGGTGFILSYVAERYAEAGDEVVLFDNNQQHEMPAYTTDLLARRKNVRYGNRHFRDINGYFNSGSVADYGLLHNPLGLAFGIHLPRPVLYAARYRDHVAGCA